MKQRNVARGKATRKDDAEASAMSGNAADNCKALRQCAISAPKIEWFCVRSKLKQERNAATSLQALPDVEVFCPRIRFQRQTRRGKIWFEEALFPGYLFARFELERMFKAVNCARGVTGLIRFGTYYPSIPAAEIESLRAWFAGKETRTIEPEPQVGQTSTIVDGPFKGLTAVVSKVMPGAQRVAVLLEFLGRQSEVQMQVSDIALTQSGPVLR